MTLSRVIVPLLTATMLAGCSAETEAPVEGAPESNQAACGAKCDGAESGQILTALSMTTFESSDVSQTVRFVGDVTGDDQWIIPDGHTLNLSIYANDGASNPDYRIDTTLEFDADNVGGYVSDIVEIGDLLPWGRLTVEVTGSLNGNDISESWDFFPGADTGVRDGSGDLPAELITTLDINNLVSEAGETESFRLIGGLAPQVMSLVEDGQELEVEIRAADGASTDFAVEGTIVFDADNVGAFISDQIDTSLLLPWRALEVTVAGQIGALPVYEEFAFFRGDNEGMHVTNEALSPTTHVESLELLDVDNIEGESETMRLIAYLDGPMDDVVQDGDVIVVEISATDGASNPDFTLVEFMTYDEEAIGGYLSETIDTSELLPYRQLQIKMRGRIGAESISETFVFTDGEQDGTRL